MPAPGAKEIPLGGGTHFTAAPLLHPPISSGKVTAPRLLRQNPPARQYGEPLLWTPSNVGFPDRLTQPP